MSTPDMFKLNAENREVGAQFSAGSCDKHQSPQGRPVPTEWNRLRFRSFRIAPKYVMFSPRALITSMMKDQITGLDLEAL